MDFLGKARRLEFTIARRLDRAARGAVGAGTRDPLEVVHLVIEAVEHEIQPGGRGKRVFPFNSITLSVLASSGEERARFEAVLAAEPPLRDRIVAQLRSRSCPIDDLTLDVAYVAKAPKAWLHPQFNLAFARVARAPTSHARRDPAFTRIDLTVLRGTAERRTYSFAAKRIDLGRCAEVRDTRNRLIRTNHVAFIEGSGEVNHSVSRRHAHIAFEPASGGYRLRDDGSVHGTSVVRNGSTVTVPPGSLGVRLRTGDELVLGEARLRVRLDGDRPSPAALQSRRKPERRDGHAHWTAFGHTGGHIPAEFGSINGLPAIDITAEAVEALLSHRWSGNIRDLRNVIERAMIVCDDGVIRASDLTPAPSCATSPDITNLGHLEQRAIERAVREAGGNRSRAARQLGISRTQLYGRLRKYGSEGVGR